MRFDPISFKAANDSIIRMEITSMRTAQTTERVKASRDAIANLVVAASNYRASTKFRPPLNPQKSVYNKSLFLKNDEGVSGE